jgi:hypothetical protein
MKNNRVLGAPYPMVTEEFKHGDNFRPKNAKEA